MFSRANSRLSVPCRTCRAEGKGVIIVEGILIFSHPELRDLLDVKIFVDTVRACTHHTWKGGASSSSCRARTQAKNATLAAPPLPPSSCTTRGGFPKAGSVLENREGLLCPSSERCVAPAPVVPRLLPTRGSRLFMRIMVRGPVVSTFGIGVV